EEGGEAVVVAGEVGRELVQDRAEALAQRLHPVHEAGERLFWLLELAVMGQVAARLGGEGERGRGLLRPSGDGLLGGEAVEARVELHRVEVLAVVLEPAPGGE